MARSSSPVLPRHHARAPNSPDGSNELVGDTIPCSPAAFSRDRSREFTQPTQILPNPGLRPADRSSSPASVIEVPASSPFQKKEPRKVGSILAPRGTIYRPPPRPPPSATAASKRPALEPVCLISDDEEDLTPPRGDIRPTEFRAKVAEFAFNPAAAAEDSDMKRKLRQIYDVFGDKFPSEIVREALNATRMDVADAITWLERQPKSQERSKTKNLSNTADRRPESSARRPPKASTSTNLDRGSSPSIASISPPKSQVPKRQKRKLVQGLKKRIDSSPQKPQPSPKPARRDVVVIGLEENDQEDAYQVEASPTPSETGDERVLHCINTSTLKELAAMTGMKEALLEPLIDKRPFENLSQAKRVSASKKPGARKASRISIGESAVDAVEVFLRAVAAIDQVVSTCEAKGRTVKSAMDVWDLDSFGHDKRSSRTSPEGDMPLTPSSLSSKYTRPPVPQQPKLMDGHCRMKPFQLFGLNWMSLLYNFEIGCILADEMGLGKTCQVISLMCHLVEEQEHQPRERSPWPNLIVVPPSTYNNWLQEFAKFAPDLSVIGYRGSQMERAEIAYEIGENLDECHVVLATYSQITTEADIDAMRSFNLNAAIFDEGHKMKNPETKTYKDLRRIPAAWKLLLTGRPFREVV